MTNPSGILRSMVGQTSTATASPGPTRRRRGTDTTAIVVEAPARADAPLTDGPLVVRGGTSLGGAVTGALVVYAAGLLFVLATRAVASYAGYRPYLLPVGGTHRAGLTAAAGIGAGLLLAFAWGGYTAGRMGRGRGWLNGLLAALAVG